MNINHDKPTPPGPKKPLRFTVRTLLVVVTAFCILFVLIGVLMRPLDWNKMLQDAAQPAGRVVVEPIGNWLRPPPDSVEIKDRKKVQELVAAITMDQPQGWDVCSCEGDTLIHFYANDKHLLTLATHHGTSLSWPDSPFIENAMLTAESQMLLRDWFARSGYEGFQQLEEKGYISKLPDTAEISTTSEQNTSPNPDSPQ